MKTRPLSNPLIPKDLIYFVSFFFLSWIGKLVYFNRFNQNNLAFMEWKYHQAWSFDLEVLCFDFVWKPEKEIFLDKALGCFTLRRRENIHKINLCIMTLGWCAFRKGSKLTSLLLYLFFFFLSFCHFGAAPAAYGGSQARGQIGAVAASLHQSHSNAGSQPRLQPTP